jgi:hypothetical protein
MGSGIWQQDLGFWDYLYHRSESATTEKTTSAVRVTNPRARKPDGGGDDDGDDGG